MSTAPFNQRMGLEQSRPIDSDIPEVTRVALAHLLVDLKDKGYLRSEETVSELLRTGRLTLDEFGFDSKAPFIDKVVHPLRKMEWWRVYTFCERVYERVLREAGYHDEDGLWTAVTDVSDVREYFSSELNLILAEDNLAYQFVNGQFQRRGRVQTQKSIQRVGLVLADPSLYRIREHFNKARKFFDDCPQPDLENCVKEATCALEACLEILTKRPASNDFAKVVKQIQGNGPNQVPSPIAEGMIKLHAYRGSGKGVAHAAPEGTKVSAVEAELVLNIVASYITYLVDLMAPEAEDVPF